MTSRLALVLSLVCLLFAACADDFDNTSGAAGAAANGASSGGAEFDQPDQDTQERAEVPEGEAAPESSHDEASGDEPLHDAVCGDHAYALDADNCVCDEGYEWCSDDPLDLSCCHPDARARRSTAQLAVDVALADAASARASCFCDDDVQACYDESRLSERHVDCLNTASIGNREGMRDYNICILGAHAFMSECIASSRTCGERAECAEILDELKAECEVESRGTRDWLLACLLAG